MYSPSTHATIDQRTVHHVMKLALATLAVLVVLAFASMLPGGSWLVPGTSVSVVAVISAVATLAVVGLLLVLAPALATLTRSAVTDDPTVASKAGTVVRIATVLIAVLIAHRGLEAAVTPLLGGIAWLYDVAFLLLSVPLLLALAIVLYTSLEPTADLWTTSLVGTDDSAMDDGQSVTPVSDAETTAADE